MIPNFGSSDTLPPGIHTATWQEFCDRYGRTKYRRKLLEGFEKGMNHLRYVGCTCIWIDGSFITDKYRPNDFDACWNEDGVDFSFLDTMYPALLDFQGKRERQKGIYGGEFFPSGWVAANNPKRTYLEFFQKDKEDNPKGIIEILL